MTLAQIISGGQTGADQAALNAAIEMGVAHGGFVPRGRLTEEGPLPAHYALCEMPTRSYPKRTEKNVLSSDGTAIFSHGPLKGGSRLTREMAQRHGKPWIHLDFEEVSAIGAALAIFNWVTRHRINVLNVAGSRASEDQRIYDKTFKALRGLLILVLADQTLAPVAPPALQNCPRSIGQAVDRLISALPLKMRVAIANMPVEDISALNTNLGNYIRVHYGLNEGNRLLLEDCRRAGSGQPMDEAAASALILLKLSEELRRTHRLRRIK